MSHRIPFFKIRFSETSRADALLTVERSFVTGNNPSYIAVLNVRMAMQANDELPELQSYYNNSLLTIPDGMPLVWYAHSLGYKKVRRTCGPDLLVDLLAISGEEDYSHYFIGSTPETLDVMQGSIASRYPGGRVLGMESPAFRPLSDEEVQTMADTINRLEPSFVWVGMSAPKQEYLIARILPLVSSNTIFIGVGLAFSYMAGEVKRSPRMLQQLGLEGIWRMIQQPERLTPKVVWRLLRFVQILLKAKIRGGDFTDTSK